MKGIMKQQMDLAEQMAQLKARPDAGAADASPASARSSSQGTAASAEQGREIAWASTCFSRSWTSTRTS